MRDLCSIDFKDNVRFVVRRYLKTLGIKVPKYKNSKTQPCTEVNRNGGVFGVCLDKVKSVNVGEDYFCSVPKFLYDASKFLQQHLHTEGLFRKSGSIQRQKALKEKLENGGVIENVQPHDVASLVKQFFRQLPEPLLTAPLHDCFIKTQRLEDFDEQIEAVLLLCILLPLSHFSALQFSMRFLAKVASCSEHSKMGTSNLAIVLTPNLMHSGTSEKQLKEETAVVDILLKNADKIGLVSEDIYERAKIIGDETVDVLTSSGDEVDDNTRRGKRQSRQRTRTGSLSGFVSGLGQSLSKFKNSSSYKTPVQNHRRSRSVKAELLRNKVKYAVDDSGLKRKEDLELENFAVRTNQRMSLRLYSRRRPLDLNNCSLSPASKRRAMLNDNVMSNEGISHPRLLSASTQMFTTPIKPLTPFKPLEDMVKPGHSRILLSSETEHVKVVDAISYVPSPSKEYHVGEPADCTSGSTIMSARSEEILESPTRARDHHARERRRDGGTHRRRIRRRHSSGATTCFSSSPRTKHQGNSKSSVSKEPGPRNGNLGGAGEHLHSATNTSMDISHISVAASVEPLDMDSGQTCDNPSPPRVFYSGSAFLKQTADLTPCKFHRGTPPMPVATHSELREVLSQRI